MDSSRWPPARPRSGWPTAATTPNRFSPSCGRPISRGCGCWPCPSCASPATPAATSSFRTPCSVARRRGWPPSWRPPSTWISWPPWGCPCGTRTSSTTAPPCSTGGRFWPWYPRPTCPTTGSSTRSAGLSLPAPATAYSPSAGRRSIWAPTRSSPARACPASLWGWRSVRICGPPRPPLWPWPRRGPPLSSTCPPPTSWWARPSTAAAWCAASPPGWCAAMSTPTPGRGSPPPIWSSTATTSWPRTAPCWPSAASPPGSPCPRWMWSGWTTSAAA